MGLADKMKISNPHTIHSYQLLPVTGTHSFRASGAWLSLAHGFSKWQAPNVAQLSQAFWGLA